MNLFTLFKSLVFTVLCLSSLLGTAQVKLGGQLDEVAPDAILEMESFREGLLIPRLTSAQRDLAFNQDTPAGMIIFNTDLQLFQVFGYTFNSIGLRSSIKTWNDGESTIPYYRLVPPVPPRQGSVYFNTTNNKFYISNGNEWIEIEPSIQLGVIERQMLSATPINSSGLIDISLSQGNTITVDLSSLNEPREQLIRDAGNQDGQGLTLNNLVNSTVSFTIDGQNSLSLRSSGTVYFTQLNSTTLEIDIPEVNTSLIEDRDADTKLLISTNTLNDDSIIFQTANQQQYAATRDGFGIGTVSPTQLVTLASNNPIIALTDSDITTSTSSFIEFSDRSFNSVAQIGYVSSNTSNFSIANELENGNIVFGDLLGINTSTPSATLSVSGTLGISGAAYFQDRAVFEDDVVLNGGLQDSTGSLGSQDQILYFTSQNEFKWIDLDNDVLPSSIGQNTNSIVYWDGSNWAQSTGFLIGNATNTVVTSALDFTAEADVSVQSLQFNGLITDNKGNVGQVGQILSTTGTELVWMNFPLDDQSFSIQHTAGSTNSIDINLTDGNTVSIQGNESVDLTVLNSTTLLIENIDILGSDTQTLVFNNLTSTQTQINIAEGNVLDLSASGGLNFSTPTSSTLVISGVEQYKRYNEAENTLFTVSRNNVNDDTARFIVDGVGEAFILNSTGVGNTQPTVAFTIAGNTLLNNTLEVTETTNLETLTLTEELYDSTSSSGVSGQVLTSTGTGVLWQNAITDDQTLQFESTTLATSTQATLSISNGNYLSLQTSGTLYLNQTGTDTLAFEFPDTVSNDSQTISFGVNQTTTQTTLEISDGNTITLQTSGTLVFNQTNTNSLELNLLNGNQIANQGTFIQTEANTDEDVIRLSTINTERVVISPNGRIGINVATPTEALDIDGSFSSNDEVTIQGTITANNLEINGLLLDTNDSAGSLNQVLYATDNQNVVWRNQSTDDQTLSVADGSSTTSSQTSLVLEADTTPINIIANDDSVLFSNPDTTTLIIEVPNVTLTDSQSLSFDSITTAQTSLSISNENSVRLEAQGLLSLNTSTSDSNTLVFSTLTTNTLQDDDNDTSIELNSNGNGAIRLNTNQNERVIVTSQGNVGIGTSTPTESLSVSGTFYSTAGTSFVGTTTFNDPVAFNQTISNGNSTPQAGQLLISNGSGIDWDTFGFLPLPSSGTNTNVTIIWSGSGYQVNSEVLVNGSGQVTLTADNFSTISSASFEDIQLTNGLIDSSGSAGTVGQVLTSTATGVQWVNDFSTDDQDLFLLTGTGLTSSTQSVLQITDQNSLTLTSSGSLNFDQTGSNLLRFEAVDISGTDSQSLSIDYSSSSQASIVLDEGNSLNLVSSGTISFIDSGQQSLTLIVSDDSGTDSQSLSYTISPTQASITLSDGNTVSLVASGAVSFASIGTSTLRIDVEDEVGTDSQTLSFVPTTLSSSTQVTLSISNGNNVSLLSTGTIVFYQTGTNTLEIGAEDLYGTDSQTLLTSRLNSLTQVVTITEGNSISLNVTDTFLNFAQVAGSTNVIRLENSVNDRIQDADNDTYLSLVQNTATTSEAIVFVTDGIERARITSAGRLGIGTASPTATVDVSGTFENNHGEVIANDIFIEANLALESLLYDANNSRGFGGQILSSTGTGVLWRSYATIPQPVSGTNTDSLLEWSGSGYFTFDAYQSNGVSVTTRNDDLVLEDIAVLNDVRLNGGLQDVNNSTGTTSQVLSTLANNTFDWVDNSTDLQYLSFPSSVSGNNTLTLEISSGNSLTLTTTGTISFTRTNSGTVEIFATDDRGTDTQTFDLEIGGVVNDVVSITLDNDPSILTLQASPVFEITELGTNTLELYYADEIGTDSQTLAYSLQNSKSVDLIVSDGTTVTLQASGTLSFSLQSTNTLILDNPLDEYGTDSQTLLSSFQDSKTFNLALTNGTTLTLQSSGSILFSQNSSGSIIFEFDDTFGQDEQTLSYSLPASATSTQTLVSIDLGGNAVSIQATSIVELNQIDTDTLEIVGNDYSRIQDEDGNTYISLEEVGHTSDVIIATNGVEVFELDSSTNETTFGQVSTPTSILTIAHKQPQLRLQDEGNAGANTEGSIEFYDSASQNNGAIRLNENGNGALSILNNRNTTTGNRILFETNGGSVGINVETPSASLDVSDTMLITGTSTFGGVLVDASSNVGTSGYVLSSTTTGTKWIDPNQQLAASFQDTSVTIGLSRANSVVLDLTEVYVNTDRQSIGFSNTTSNSTQLVLSDGSTFTLLTDDSITLSSTSSQHLLLEGVNRSNEIRDTVGTLTSVGFDSDDALLFRNNGVNSGIISPNGNFGIGTQSPTTSVQVSGTFSIQSTLTLSGALVDSVGSSGDVGDVLLSTTSGTLLWDDLGDIEDQEISFSSTTQTKTDLQISNTNSLSLQSQGLLSFDNSASDSSTLVFVGASLTSSDTIRSSNNQQRVEVDGSTNSIAFTTNNVQRLNIDSSGNVQINSSTATATLSVNGSMTITDSSTLQGITSVDTLTLNNRLVDSNGFAGAISSSNTLNLLTATGTSIEWVNFSYDDSQTLEVGSTVSTQTTLTLSNTSSSLLISTNNSSITLSRTGTNLLIFDSPLSNNIIITDSKTPSSRVETSGTDSVTTALQNLNAASTQARNNGTLTIDTTINAYFNLNRSPFTRAAQLFTSETNYLPSLLPTTYSYTFSPRSSNSSVINYYSLQFNNNTDTTYLGQIVINNRNDPFARDRISGTVLTVERGGTVVFSQTLNADVTQTINIPLTDRVSYDVIRLNFTNSIGGVIQNLRHIIVRNYDYTPSLLNASQAPPDRTLAVNTDDRTQFLITQNRKVVVGSSSYLFTPNFIDESLYPDFTITTQNANDTVELDITHVSSPTNAPSSGDTLSEITFRANEALGSQTSNVTVKDYAGISLIKDGLDTESGVAMIFSTTDNATSNTGGSTPVLQERMRINSEGQIGIGTSTLDQASLTIDGNVKIEEGGAINYYPTLTSVSTPQELDLDEPDRITFTVNSVNATTTNISNYYSTNPDYTITNGNILSHSSGNGYHQFIFNQTFNGAGANNFRLMDHTAVLVTINDVNNPQATGRAWTDFGNNLFVLTSNPSSLNSSGNYYNFVPYSVTLYIYRQ